MSPESIVSFYDRSVKNGMGFEVRGVLPLKGFEYILVNPGGAIRFFSGGDFLQNKGVYILIHHGDKMTFWSDFAEKDPSAQKISGARYGRHLLFQEFVDDMRIHMPNHFEWMLWNFV